MRQFINPICKIQHSYFFFKNTKILINSRTDKGSAGTNPIFMLFF
jgi:hypothetical protein